MSHDANATSQAGPERRVESAEQRLAQVSAPLVPARDRSRKQAQRSSLIVGEYEQQLTQRAAIEGIGVAELRDYQAFLARITEAMRQQQSLVPGASRRSRYGASCAEQDGEQSA